MKRYLLLLLALFFAALNFNIVLKPLQLVTGGTQGIALLLNHISKLSPALLIFLINIITLIISYFTLSKTVTYGTIIASFAYPLFVKITSIIPLFSVVTKYFLLFSIVAGIVCGFTGGYIYQLGFSSGGINTINLLVNKYFKIKVAVSNFLINTIIILLGSFFFGIRNGLYSVIIILISSFIINYLLKKNRFVMGKRV